MIARLAPAQSSGPYRVADSIVITGFDRSYGDFYAIDVKHRRLYGADHKVVNIDTKQIVAQIADSMAGGGFMLAPELGRGVVRDGTIFDLETAAVVGHVDVLYGDGTTYDPATERAFLFRNDTVAAIDVKAGTLVGTVAVDDAGESGVADGTGKLYLNLHKRDSIAVLDAKTLTRVGGFSIAPCKAPMGLAMDRVHRRLFAACDGALGVIDADKGTVVATVPTGGYTDQNAFDPGTGLIFMPNGSENGVVIIHEDTPDRYTVVQRLMNPALSEGHSNKIVVDEQTHRAYVPSYRSRTKTRTDLVYVVLEPVKR